MNVEIQYQVDLFAENLPSYDNIRKLSDFVNSSERSQLDFRCKIEANSSKTDSKASLANGIGLSIINRNKEAIEKLNKGENCLLKFLYLAYTYRKLGEYDLAIQNLQKSLEHQADSFMINIEKTATYRDACNYEAARNEIKKCANMENISAEYHYQLARLQETQGQYVKALANYKKAVELSPNHQKALFHLAFRLDLNGSEDEAIEYYKRIISSSTVYVNAMLNLAVLYEDGGKYDLAEKYIDTILEYFPNHKRATLFKKDIDSSKTMFYDEEREQKKTRKNQILETPISDFELSVRSRNCLKKMNINTVGDLLNISEVELLSYKNFGETSLREIKAILELKSLRLGMVKEEKFMTTEEPDKKISPNEQGLLSKSIEEFQLSVRAKKCLQKLNIRTLGELISKTEAELLGCKNFGVTSLNEIKRMIVNLGLSLRNLS